MEVEILVHFSLRVDKHIANEFLDSRHHELGLDLEELVFLLHLFQVFLIAVIHFVVLFLDGVEERLGVFINLQYFFLLKDLIVGLLSPYH